MAETAAKEVNNKKLLIMSLGTKILTILETITGFKEVDSIKLQL